MIEPGTVALVVAVYLYAVGWYGALLMVASQDRRVTWRTVLTMAAWPILVPACIVADLHWLLSRD